MMDFKTIDVKIDVPIGNHCSLTENTRKVSCLFCIKSNKKFLCKIFNKTLESDFDQYKDEYKDESKVFKCSECISN